MPKGVFYLNEASRAPGYTSAPHALTFPNIHFYPNWWHMPEHTNTHTPSNLPFNKPLKSVNYSGGWRDVLCHLQRHPHKLETRGTSALSSAVGSCQHILTSPGGVQLGLTSSGAPGPPVPTAATSLSVSLSSTQLQNPARAYMRAHKSANTHTCSGAPTCLQPRSYVPAPCHSGPQTTSVLRSHQAQSQRARRLYWPATFMCFFFARKERMM